MKKSLPCFTALSALMAASLAIAQSPQLPAAVASSPAVPATKAAALPNPQPLETGQGRASTAQAIDQFAPGDQLLIKAASQLEHRASIAARLQYNVSVSGQTLKGYGSYWQQGSGDELKIRLELVASKEAELLEVSNGRFLWIDRRLPIGRTVTRYDLHQLRADPALAPPGFDKLDPGKANWSAVQPLLTAHSGGLPSLLASLHENFSFRPPQPMQLALAQPNAAPDLKVPVFATVGQWKPDKLASLLAKSDAEANAISAASSANTEQAKPKRIPARLPQEVLLLVGQADLFPYRIEYRKLETPAVTNDNGPPIPYQLSIHPLVVLELSHVVFDGPIAAGQFEYSPGDIDWVDQTASLLEHLRREREAQVATRSEGQSALPTR
ncbi:MAG TPA: hypothetical protein VHE81_14935 [Lacipirellulaceae bacterium]|nr:hypothetical protein [Lacipirellulaceae bacterium]